MWGKNFNSFRNDHGFIGIRNNNSKSLCLLCYKSPYSSLKNNMWLERRLLAAYTGYYRKVMYESGGQFSNKR